MRWFVVLLILITLSLYLTRHRTTPAPPPPSLEQIQKLATLVTLRLSVDDRVEVTARGYLGELNVVWRGPGVVLIGPDLQKARVIGTDQQNRVLTIALPEPAVLSTQVDLSRGRFERIEFDGLWWLMPSDQLRLRVQQQTLAAAQKRLGSTVIPELRRQARAATEAALRRLNDPLGWTLHITWTE